MKLILVLSLVACSYAAKLDRTYLPPSNAATAGGSPGSLTAPSGPSGFGQAPSAKSPGFGQGSFGGSGFSGAPAPTGPSGFAPHSGQNQGAFNQGSQGFGQQGSQGFAQQGNQGFAAPRDQPERPQAAADRTAEILKYENVNDGNTFAYSFETSNGISAEESGVATNGVQAQGGFSYTGDDGQFYKITYTADENGYVPQGDHLPTSPPIPEEILRSIETNARAAAAGTQEGAYRPEEYESDNTQHYNAGGSSGQAQGHQSSGPQGYPQGPQGPQGAPQPAFNQGPSQFGTGSQSPQSVSKPAFNQGPNIFGAGPQGPQAPSGSFGKPSTPQRQFQGQTRGQGQDGYQYNKPQANTFGSAPRAQPSPNAVQPQYKPQPQGPRPGPAPSSFKPQGPAPSEPRPAQPAPARPSFGGPSQGPAPGSRPAQPSRPSFGGQASPGFRGNQPAQPGPSGYEYNRPAQPNQAQSSGPKAPQPGFPQPSQGQGQAFGGPRQPPSFSEQEGYKY